jgi:hypothetical protein
MTAIPKSLKKLRETRFFLARMTKAARSTRLDREDFDFYLGAFLGAGRSVTLVLQVEQKDFYDATCQARHSSRDEQHLNQTNCKFPTQQMLCVPGVCQICLLNSAQRD